jgi:hypothetical protein
MARRWHTTTRNADRRRPTVITVSAGQPAVSRSAAGQKLLRIKCRSRGRTPTGAAGAAPGRSRSPACT